MRDLAQSPLLQRLYRSSPPIVQNVFVSLYGLSWARRRLGGVFRDELPAIAEREWWPSDRLHAYCDERVRALVQWAYDSTPHYRQALDSHGIDPTSIRGTADLRRLPLLTKEGMRQDPTSFLAKGCSGGYSYSTSGTTGTPINIVFDPPTHQRVSAYLEVRARRWAGVSYRDSRSMIGGRLVVPVGQRRPPYWRRNWVERQLYLSAFHIGLDTVQDYTRALNTFRPDYMTGYTVSNYLLARLIQERGIVVHQPKALLVSSETLHDHMRHTMEAVYGTKVFDGYSGVEACCLATECSEGHMHVSSDLGHVEILDPAGKPVPPGTPGEIVATGFLNFTQPLIRFRTGDVAAWSNSSCPCGRTLPILTGIDGRLEDVIVTSDGREMVRFHGLYVGVPCVREGQLVQEEVDRFVVRVVASPGFTSEHMAILVRRVRERVGDAKVEVVVEESIERTRAGKMRAVVSKVRRSPAIVRAN